MSAASTAIFLSPHFDDIALSCGGMAARLSRMGARCIGLTIFAAPPPVGEPLSPIAEELHARWQEAGGSAASANEMRREEERAALKLLGLQPRMLDLPDAPYRRSPGGTHPYGTEEGLFGPVAPWEVREVAPLIASEVRYVAREAEAKGRVRVFAPLGVGNHVDHRLTFWAARLLPPRYGVLFYEDYPYAAREGALGARLTTLARMGLRFEPRASLMTELIGIKIAAITRYKSQLPVLFGSPEAMPHAVRAYNQKVAGGNGFAERFWYVPPAYTLGA
jgi:LmbE family N-acetylglucosaminyl deacetylase